MSEPIKKILAPSDALRQAHGIPKGKHIDGHKVTIKGLYFAVLKKTGEKVKREYSETIFFHPAEDLVHGQGALGRVLREKLLDEVLAERDPEFRSIHTHEVHEHENCLVDAPAPDEEGLDDELAPFAGSDPENQ